MSFKSVILGLVGAGLVMLVACRPQEDSAPQPSAKAKPAQNKVADDPLSMDRPATQEDAALPVGEADSPDAAHRGPPAKTPMIRGLQQMVDSALSERVPERGQIHGQLRQADDALSQVRAENMKALREVNRQPRVAGEDLPCVVWMIVPDLRRDQLGCYGTGVKTPAIDKLAGAGVRFDAYHCGELAGGAWLWSLWTGRAASRVPDEKAAELRGEHITAAEVLWGANYATALIGDCNLGGLLGNSTPEQHGFQSWFGYRQPADMQSGYPEQLWSNGASLRVSANAGGKQGDLGQDLLMQEVRSFLERARRGPPFLLCLVWPLPRTGKEPDIGRLDRDVEAIVAQLSKLKMDRRTVLILAGGGEGSGKSAPDGPLAPLIVWAPGRFPGGKVSARPCTTSDLLPTLVELSGAVRKPKNRDGASLVPELTRKP